MKRLARKALVRIVCAGLVLLLASPAWAGTVVLTMPHCGCCDGYVKYLQENGFDVTSQSVKDMDKTGKEYGVPGIIAICHLMKIDGYVVVGHVPVSAIRRLLRDKPHNVAGIALPGMPAGSPGMAGKRVGPLVVYAFDKQGHTWVYDKI